MIFGNDVSWVNVYNINNFKVLCFRRKNPIKIDLR